MDFHYFYCKTASCVQNICMAYNHYVLSNVTYSQVRILYHNVGNILDYRRATTITVERVNLCLRIMLFFYKNKTVMTKKKVIYEMARLCSCPHHRCRWNPMGCRFGLFQVRAPNQTGLAITYFWGNNDYLYYNISSA